MSLKSRCVAQESGTHVLSDNIDSSDACILCGLLYEYWNVKLPLVGAELIVQERVRQIVSERWTPEHDEQHSNHELTYAAVAYAVNGINDGTILQRLDFEGSTRAVFPMVWHPKWDKRESKNRIQSLTIAGALIAADIDRIISTGDPA